MKIEIDSQDIKTLLNLLEGTCERKKIINYIKEYIFLDEFENTNNKLKGKLELDK